jgi:hypothetical protein
MTKAKTLRDYLAPEFKELSLTCEAGFAISNSEFKELSLTCEAGFAISNEGLTDENWDWDAPQA